MTLTQLTIRDVTDILSFHRVASVIVVAIGLTIMSHGVYGAVRDYRNSGEINQGSAALCNGGLSGTTQK